MMGLEVICPRCGGPMRAWTQDMYGRMCRECKKSGKPPSEEQVKKFEDLMRGVDEKGEVK